MADDTSPLSTTVPETVTIDTRADPQSAASAEAALSDFWKEIDEKAEAAPPPPPAPSESEAKESKKQDTGVEVDMEPVPESKPAAKERAPEPIPEHDVDKMELSGPNAPRPEHVEQFRKIKELWKADQRKAEEANKRLQAVEAQLAEAKANALTPETKADYENAVQLRRRFYVASDPVFKAKHDTAIAKQFVNVLEEAVQALPDRQEAIKWAEDVRTNWGPDKCTRNWWLNNVVAMVPNELERNSLLASVNDLVKQQREREKELHFHTHDKSAYDNWTAERDNFVRAHNEAEIRAEMAEQESKIKEVFPVDVSQAKTADERRAMEAHNQRFERLNKFFTDTLADISNGPRGWARAAIEATRSHVKDERISGLEQELKDTKAERDQLKTEMEKINGARRRIINTAPTAAESRKNGSPSLKDLSDPRKALSDYWEEIDRNQ